MYAIMFVRKNSSIFFASQLDKRFPTRENRLYDIEVLTTNTSIGQKHINYPVQFNSLLNHNE